MMERRLEVYGEFIQFQINEKNLMPDRGGVTANHYDHVHVSFIR